MFWRVLSAAVLAAAVGLPLALAQAQTIAQIGDPAELPPSGFKGDQFVDSRGCVFMRINSGGQNQWYPRVNSSHKVVCGYPPTFGAQPKIEMAETAPAPAAKPAPVAVAAAPAAPAPAAKPAAAPVVVAAQPAPVAPVVKQASVVKAAPAPAPAPAPVVVAAQPAPYVSTAPASYQVASSRNIPAGKIGCFRSAPVAEVVQLRNGGTAVVCTRGDGTATGWRAPIYPAGAPVGAALRDSNGVMVASTAPAPAARPAAAAAVPVMAAVAPAPTFTVPKGYKLAWDDDRLNPLRGQGTAQGWAQQDQIWTRTVPAELITDATNPLAASAPVYQKSASKVTVSSKSAPTAAAQPAAAAPAASSGRLWVQVGSFGVPENAQGATSRLQALGLPVGKSKISSGGKTLQVVLAGPFGSSADAQAALALARQAGFGDAFVR